MNRELSDLANEFGVIAKKINTAKDQTINLRNEQQANFRYQFRSLIDVVIVPLIDTLNLKLEPGSLKFEILPEISKSYCSVLLVLRDADSDLNLQSNPYLIVDGYPDSNTVRVVKAFSPDQGQKLILQEFYTPDLLLDYQQTIAIKLLEIVNQVASKDFA